MKMVKSTASKRPDKQDRERKVLLGLVEYFIQTGKPVGSHALKDAGFDDLSSATIRNYFAHLEEDDYLSQQHSSGGRLPTDRAYKVYAEEHLDRDPIQQEAKEFTAIRQSDSKEIAAFMQKSADTLSNLTNCAVFLSAPRFDHDFVVELKLVPIDAYRCLCIMITDFGVIQTETMPVTEKISSFAAKRIESYFHWRLSGLNKPENLDPSEEALAQAFYNELMVRYLVGYANFIDEEIYRTGFSRLLSYPDFQEASALATSLTLFEDAHAMRLLLKESTKIDNLKFWIGEDLFAYSSSNPNCAVIAIPYYINQKAVGAIGILGPKRMPYREHFTAMRLFSEAVSEALTRNIYKFKVTFREPQQGALYLSKHEKHNLHLLEDKTKQ
jgi:heat-inducible transcriptional repressor